MVKKDMEINKINWSTWKQYEKWHYDIREGDVLRGEIVKEGHGFESEKLAKNELKKQLKSINKLFTI